MWERETGEGILCYQLRQKERWRVGGRGREGVREKERDQLEECKKAVSDGLATNMEDTLCQNCHLGLQQIYTLKMYTIFVMLKHNDSIHNIN